MRARTRASLIVGAVVVMASQAVAQPVAAGLGAFSGATVVDFNTIGNEVQITNQYAGQGVTFSAALYGLTNFGDLQQFPANGGGVVATNWLYSHGTNGGLSFTATWSAPQSMVGFYLENWPQQTAVVEIFKGSTSLGTINFAPTTSLLAPFFGLSSAQGFDSMTLTNDSAVNGFFAIDDFQFIAAPTAAPEPASFALVASGLLGVVGVARRGRRRA